MTEPGTDYSLAFRPERRRPVRSVLPLGEITPEWAWGGSTGRGVRVGVIDSGIEATHVAVGERVRGFVAISGPPDALVYDTAPHGDAYGHATACAGIIRRTAPDCDLYSIKVLGDGLTGRGIHFAAGLRWAIENGMQVCNLSLGTTKRDFFALFHELADLAYFRNIVLVTAANNNPVPAYPSVYASVISVASHEVDDPYLIYCNPDPPVEFGAPGIDLTLAWRGGDWITGTGNSYAAPHVSGLVACMLAKHPDLTVQEVRLVLRALAANAVGEPSSPRRLPRRRPSGAARAGDSPESKEFNSRGN